METRPSQRLYAIESQIERIRKAIVEKYNKNPKM